MSRNTRNTRNRDDIYNKKIKINKKINKYKDNIIKTKDVTVLKKINDDIVNDNILKRNDKSDLVNLIGDKFNKLISDYELNKNPLNGINKISAKGINNYIKLNFSKKKYYFDLFEDLYKHVVSIYGEDNNTIIYMLLMLDSVHDFIGERTTLEKDVKSLMIQTIFQIRDSDYLFNKLNKLKAGDFENDLLLWLLYIKYNDIPKLVQNTLFGDVISIAEQTKKDNMSSLFTIDAFDKSFDAYRTTLFYLNRPRIQPSELSSQIEQYKDIHIFRIQVIELYNNLLKILKNKDKKLDKKKWQQAIHAIRNYILSFNFENLKDRLFKLSNTRTDLENNMQLFFSNFQDNYQGKNKIIYYYNITEIRSNLKQIITLLKIIDESSEEIILVNGLLNRVNNMNQPLMVNIKNFYDKPIDKFDNTTENDGEVEITDALKQTEKNIINGIINHSRNYIEFVAIPPQLFDANESTGGENMTILGIKNQINMIRQQTPMFEFELLQDQCTLTYDLTNNCTFTITNDNYPIKIIEIRQNFIISQFGLPWVKLLNKYAYNVQEKKIICGSCPGVTDLFELYKFFQSQDQSQDQSQALYALKNIFQIKRAGDYSQIKFCQEFNIKKILFLSNDRMSSSFCLMMGVPFVAPVYSGVMGSKTFSVYYNPSSDNSMLYEINREEFSDYDIEKLLIKLQILQKECNQLSDICDNSDIREAIDRLNTIKKDTNIYDKYNILLTSQEIYDKNKYKVKKEGELLAAAGLLFSIGGNPAAIANRIIHPLLFFNDQQIMIHNQLYRSIEKLYYYILSLDFKQIENRDKVIENYVFLYNSIQKDIVTFFNAQSTLDGTSTLQKIPSLPKTQSLSSSSSNIPIRTFTEISKNMLLAAGQSPEKINSPPPEQQSQYPPFYKKNIVGDGLCLFRSILYSISQLSLKCKIIILHKINSKLNPTYRLKLTDLKYNLNNQDNPNVIITCRKLAIIIYQELIENINTDGNNFYNQKVNTTPYLNASNQFIFQPYNDALTSDDYTNINYKNKIIRDHLTAMKDKYSEPDGYESIPEAYWPGQLEILALSNILDIIIEYQYNNISRQQNLKITLYVLYNGYNHYHGVDVMKLPDNYDKRWYDENKSVCDTINEGIGMDVETVNKFDSNTDTRVKYVYHNFDKDISLQKYKNYDTVMFYNEKGYLLVQDFNPDAVIKIKSLTKAKEHTYPDGTKITFKLN
jgi:hypothetical protein